MDELFDDLGEDEGVWINDNLKFRWNKRSVKYDFL